MFFFFFKQKTAYEMRISDWSSDVCSSDLPPSGTSALSMIPMVGANVWTCFAKAEWRPDGAAQGTGFEVLSANIAQSAQCDARRAGGCDRRWQTRHIVCDGCPRAVPQGRIAGGVEGAGSTHDVGVPNRP